MNNNQTEITREPITNDVGDNPCFATIEDESTGKVIWADGPFTNRLQANQAAEKKAVLLNCGNAR